MNSDMNYLRNLESAAKHYKDIDPWTSKANEEQANALRQKLVQLEDARQELLNCATDKGRANQLYSEITRQVDGDSFQLVSRLLGACMAEGLLEPEDFRHIQGMLVKKTEYEERLDREITERRTHLEKTLHQILETVGSRHSNERRDALAIYNQLDYPLTEEKLETFVKKLIERKLLPFSYNVTRHSGFLTKMLQGAKENK